MASRIQRYHCSGGNRYYIKNTRESLVLMQCHLFGKVFYKIGK